MRVGARVRVTNNKGNTNLFEVGAEGTVKRVTGDQLFVEFDKDAKVEGAGKSPLMRSWWVYTICAEMIHDNDGDQNRLKK